jgi:hypothetical protein
VVPAAPEVPADAPVPAAPVMPAAAASGFTGLFDDEHETARITSMAAGQGRDFIGSQMM